MTFHLELIKSLKDPETKFYQLKIAEVIPIHLGKLTLLLLLGIMVSLIRMYYGLDTAGLSHQLTEYSPSEFEFMKFMVGLGSVLGAAFSPLIYLLFTSLCFWLFLDGVSFRQAWVVGIVSVFIFTIGKVALLPFELTLGIDSVTSPFALGIVGSHFATNDFFIHLFGELSFFFVWSILIQFYAYSILAAARKWLIALLILGVHLLTLVFSVLKTFLVIYVTLS